MKSKIKTIVCGAAGQMGWEIVSALYEDQYLVLSAAIDEKAGLLHKINVLSGGNAFVGNDIKEGVSKGEVVIDFSTPSATLVILQEAVSQKKAMVIGTTGFSQEEKKMIMDASKKIPIVVSPNMSVGVHVVFKLLADAAAALGDGYDVEIVEMHHRRKKDVPSGTALRMGEVIAAARGTTIQEVGRFSRYGTTGERPSGEIGIHALRGGDEVGDHRVIFAGLGERIEISHRASSRKNFAEGALIAARWIFRQRPGLYDMMDVLNLKRRSRQSLQRKGDFS